MQIEKKAIKVRRLIETRVVADVPSHVLWGTNSHEEKVRRIEAWAKELNDFIRDHRSQDGLPLSVERVYQNQCSCCYREWETYLEEGKTFCANCGAEVE